MPLSPEVIAWKREQERRHEEQPRLELPLPPPGWEPPRPEREERPAGSTVIVIDLM